MAHRRGRDGLSGSADFMITKEKHAHRVFFFRDHGERRGSGLVGAAAVDPGLST
jgi:hypothetical protein